MCLANMHLQQGFASKTNINNLAKPISSKSEWQMETGCKSKIETKVGLILEISGNSDFDHSTTNLVYFLFFWSPEPNQDLGASSSRAKPPININWSEKESSYNESRCRLRLSGSVYRHKRNANFLAEVLCPIWALAGTITISELFKKDGVKVVLCLPYFMVLGLLFKQAQGWFEVNDTIQ